VSFLRKNHTFSHPFRRTRHWEVEVGINSTAKSYEDVHTAQSHHFRAQALPQSGMKDVVPHIEVGFNPHVGLAKGHKGHHV
jgi:hypothetical protein